MALRPGDNRDTHPQCIAACQATGEWKRVECNIYVSIFLQNIYMKRGGAQFNAVGINSSFGKGLPDCVTECVIHQCSLLQNKAGIRNSKKNLGPYVKKPIIQLGGIVKTTKSNIPGFYSGWWSNFGRCPGNGLIAETARRQAHNRFDKLSLCPRRGMVLNSLMFIVKHKKTQPPCERLGFIILLLTPDVLKAPLVKEIRL